jgi:hypothetical protein
MAERNLNIVINAKNNATKEINGLSSALEKNKATIQKTTLAATAAFAGITAAIGSSVRAYGAAGDQIQKMALRTGFSTTALSELKHAAEQSGTSLEKLEAAVMKSNRLLAQTDQESATARKALEELGLSVEELNKMNMEDRFFAMAGAVAKIEDPGRRAATAMDVFGKSGAELLPMLESGAEGIQAMRDEAHKLGIVFDQEAADKAAKFTDAMDKMNKSIDGIKFTLAEAFLPIIIDVTDGITDFLLPVQQWIRENPVLVRNIALVALAVTGLIALMGTITLAFLAFNPVSITVMGIFAAIGSAILILNELLKRNGKTWRDVWDGIVIFMDGVFGSIFDVVTSIGKVIIDVVNFAIKAINRLIEMAKSVPMIGNRFKDTKKITEMTFDGMVAGRQSFPRSEVPGMTVVNVYGDVSGEELVNKVKFGIMSDLSNNTRLTSF